MVKEFQKLNPSNARITIDYKKRNVDIQYVQNDSAFKICYKTFKNPLFSLYIIFIAMGIFVWGANYNSMLNKYEDISKIPTTQIFIEHLWGGRMVVGAMVFYYGTPAILALIFSRNERLLKMIPEINYRLTKGSPVIAEFYPKNVSNNKVEIPLFRNIGLDYEATEEFSEYLTRVEIKEHGFNMIINGKKKLDPYLWKAIFYFDKKPKTGKLEVKFK